MFTRDNTDGFTSDELETMNEVLSRLLEEANPQDDWEAAQNEKNYSDRIHNAFRTGMSADELYQAAQARA